MNAKGTTVAVIDGPDASAWLEPVGALAAGCGLAVKLVRPGEDLGGCVGVVSIAHAPAAMLPAHLPTIRIVLSSQSEPARLIEFSDLDLVPRVWRSQQVESFCAAGPCAGLDTTGADVLASSGGHPLWTSATRDGCRHDAYFAPAELQPGSAVFEHLNGRSLLTLLPLLEWLRAIAGWNEWQYPTTRACLMFDDPNLHSVRYGHVSYEELAREGARHNYHTSFATVPLDSFFVSSSAAALFRRHPDRLSLLFHGNNHSHRELAARRTAAEWLAQMAQAVKRIENLERRAGISVSRVMAPPHGVCSADAIMAMLRVGIEAACLSHGSLRAGNSGANWTRSIGAAPVHVVNGLPVIPRFGFSQHLERTVRLAAYLNQPLIPVAHHWDLAEGNHLLTNAAEIINRLGPVNWLNPGAIARSNYRYRVKGDVMTVECWSRRIDFAVPPAVSRVEVQYAWPTTCDEEVVATDGLSGTRAIGRSFAVAPHAPLTVTLPPILSAARAGTMPITPPAVVARKILVEIRDRLMPLLPVRIKGVPSAGSVPHPSRFIA